MSKRETLCTCEQPAPVVAWGQCSDCGGIKVTNLIAIEMSTDGEAWEEIKLPPNSLPYHQAFRFGEYHDTVLGVYYRRIRKDFPS